MRPPISKARVMDSDRAGRWDRAGSKADGATGVAASAETGAEAGAWAGGNLASHAY